LQPEAANSQEYSLRIGERGAILDASANFPSVAGVDNLNTLRGCSLRKFLEDYAWQRLQQIMNSADGDGRCDDLELELRGLSGESRMFSFSGEIWRHEGGWPGGMVGTLRDTSRRRRWDDDLADSEARYRALFNQGNDPVLVFRDQQIIDFNQQALEVFGATSDQLAGKSVEALSPALQPGQLQSSELIRQKFDAVSAGQALRFEWRGRRFDGVPIDLEVSLSVVDLAGKPCVQAIMRDVTEQLAVRAALQRSEQMYNTIVNNSGDSIIVIDLDRKVVFTNRRFQQLTGADESVVLGRDYVQFLDDRDRESAIELFNKNFATGEPLHAEFWVTTQGESQIRVEVNALLTEHENIPAMIAFVRDITEQYQAGKAQRDNRDNLAEQVTMKTLSLTLALDQAEAANRAKSRFLANMSHELRTPLHSVLSFAEIGESRAADDGSDQLLGYFNRIQTSGKRLLELLNDLLDLTQLESGRVEYHQEWCDLSQLVGKTLDDMQVEIGSRQVAVKVVPADASVRAWCDFERVAQVVTNLVSNALKFSDPGSPVSVTLSSNAQQQAMVMVEDKGVGLPEDRTDHLFDPFVESERTRTEAGGLGLAICKQIVDAHGGTIGGFNKNGGGASFYFTLPADRAVDPPAKTDD
jgi:PAS domain S-box-containing protein